MAQTGYTPISIYYSATAAAAPTAGNLVAGELAINTNDGKLYYKDSAGVVQTLASKAVASGSFTNLAYTGTFTGGTGVIAIGTNQIYKDASGNVGLGTTSPSSGGKLSIISAVAQDCAQFTDNTNYTVKITSGGSAVGLVTGATGSALALGSNGSEKVRIDTSGNVGIGTASPVAVGGYGALTLNGTTGSLVYLQNNGTSALQIATNSSGVQFAALGASIPMYFVVNSAERMRIDTSGNLLVGTTAVIVNAKINSVFDQAGASGIAIRNTNASDTGYLMAFYNSSAGLQGSITQTNSSVTAYNSTSDYRLKENIKPMVGALDKVSALKPVTYNWKIDGSDGQGFIAHELQKVVPDCVTGKKDAVDAEGKPQYQGIDTSFLVATLTAAIQELNAKVTALEAQLGAK